jgi:hypothetical protein
MFIKGSRYRNISESTAVDASGERLRGKDLRLIPETDGRFLHTVREGDRLDLVSFKYYGDATKWWQVADANPQSPFPSDLLDARPLVRERFVVRHPGFETRFRDLVLALSALGQVTTPTIDSFEGVTPVQPGFIETTLVVTYPPSPATHQAIVDLIRGGGIEFDFLRAIAWQAGPNTAEAFSFDDPSARKGWRTVEETLSSAPGVFSVESVIAEGELTVSYNSAVLDRDAIVRVLELNGFAILPDSAAFPSAGSKIVIPPNQIV